MRVQLMNAMMGVLLLTALVELLWAVGTRKRIHGFRDTMSSMSLGIGQQAINIYLSAAFLGLWDQLHVTWGLAAADMRVWWHWLLFIPACDLAYYCAHRCGHTVNFWVAAHVVHHHAEDFNHLSALRQSWTAWIVNFPFFLPLALFVPLEMFVVGQLGIMFLQFLSHNGVYRGKLGVLDRIFVTPANHRVHHGLNRPYLGANCGGMFVIWDRVFGTYVEEDPDIPIELGTGLRLNFYDPFEANLDYYRRVLFVSRHRKGLYNRLSIWWQSPRVLIDELRALGYRERTTVPREPLSTSDKLLVSGLFVTAVAVFAAHRVLFEGHGAAGRVATGVGVMVVLALIGRAIGTRQSLGRSQVSAR